MTKCSVRWRPSGGRGEFEFVPGNALVDRDIIVEFGALRLRISAEVVGRNVQGKPRLRKHNQHDRKLHLPQLVMAVASLPEMARQDKGGDVQFPLENKKFVMNEMTFGIIEDDGRSIVLSPLQVSVRRSDFKVNLKDRFRGIARDWREVDKIRQHDSNLADAIVAHKEQIFQGVNSRNIRRSADDLIDAKSDLFGHTNSGSVTQLIMVDARSEVEAEEIVGREGRLLTRLHIYRERDRTFARKVRQHYKSIMGGKLVCHACDSAPEKTYGPHGESAIEAHHKIPIEQLQPDSATLLRDMAMLCANCHRVVHSQKPCFTVEEVSQMMEDHKL